MVILHKLLHKITCLSLTLKSREEEIEDDRKESFLEIFIYFQLLSMFCRCKGRTDTILLCCVEAGKKALLFYLVSGFLWAFNEIPLFDSSVKFKFTRNPLKGLWDFFYAWGHKSCEYAIFFMAECMLDAGWKKA